MPHKPHAVVLTYHRLPDAKMANAKFHDLPFDRFRMQMEMVAERALSGTPAPNVCITFDDGRSDHMKAGNLLSELGLTGTFFIITGRLGQERVTSLATRFSSWLKKGIASAHTPLVTDILQN